MKRIYILIMAIGLTFSCLAQEQLPIDTINGTLVYRYAVQKSEGLYRISKNFGVSQEELIRFNPSLKTEGLKYGQTIYVPVKDNGARGAVASTVSTSPSPQEEKAQGYITHIIQKGETLYGLSKRYGVRVEDIQAANPEMSVKMYVDGKLLIPVSGSSQSEAKADEPSLKPEIKADEPGVKPEIKAEEPGLKKEDFKSKKADLKAERKAEKLTDKQQDKLASLAGRATEESATKTTPLILREGDVSALPLRLAFLLPFNVDAINRDATMDRFVEFYEGALIAVYEAQQMGQHFDIYTYDVQKASVAVQRVLQQGEMQNMDAIIGPAYPAQVSYVDLFAKNNHIPTLIPFTNKVSGIEHNPYLLQFNASDELEAKAAIEQLGSQKGNIHFIFVDSSSKDVPAFVSTLRDEASRANFSIGETSTTAILNDSLRYALVQGKKNILVFNAEKYSSVNVLMNKITSQRNGCELAFFGRYSWSNENPAIPMVYVSMFHSPEASQIAAYDALYKKYFGHSLSSNNPRYDLLGYDLTKSLIAYLLGSQQATTEAQKDAVFETYYRGLQSNISYVRCDANGGRINSGIQLIWK